MYRLTNPIRRSDWGSSDDIPALLGFSSDGGPYAELWLSGFEAEPSTVRIHGRDRPLCEVVSERLPFLAKVLAIGSPLSLQLHPRAPRPKPEMLYAITPCRLLCGLRPVAEAVTLLRGIGAPSLRPVLDALCEAQDAVLKAMSALLGLASPRAAASAVCSAAAVTAEAVAVTDTVATLAQRYPDDAAALAPLMLNVLDLAPGEAVFCPPGQPHTYLSGLGFEVQANSDEVVRGGLSTKPVDVAGFVSEIDTGVAVRRVEPRREAGEVRFDAGAGFALSVREDGSGPLVPTRGPQLLLCVHGRYRLGRGGHWLTLRRGQSAFVPGGSSPLVADGAGLLLRVSTGRAG